jgi:hypothetical protein
LKFVMRAIRRRKRKPEPEGWPPKHLQLPSLEELECLSQPGARKKDRVVWPSLVGDGPGPDAAIEALAALSVDLAEREGDGEQGPEANHRSSPSKRDRR